MYGLSTGWFLYSLLYFKKKTFFVPRISPAQFDVVYNEKLWRGKLRNVEEENCISSISDATIRKPIKKPDLHWN